MDRHRSCGDVEQGPGRERGTDLCPGVVCHRGLGLVSVLVAECGCDSQAPRNFAPLRRPYER
eukprot:39421-Chlamydomonas_euryale.AAC.4